MPWIFCTRRLSNRGLSVAFGGLDDEGGSGWVFKEPGCEMKGARVRQKGQKISTAA